MTVSTTVQEIQPAVPHDIAQEKIKFGEKFAYFLATMAPNPILTLASSFLMIFYTDVVGLNPIAIGTLFLISRIMDGLSDPLMGYVIDHLPRTKMGKYRYVMIGGTIITCLNFFLMWLGPAWAPSGKLVIAYITYLVLGFTFDLMDISKNSLLPAMTANNKERSNLGMALGLGTILSSILVSIAAPIILDAGNRSLSAFSTVVLIVTGSVLFFGVVGALGVKERVIPVEDNTKHSVKEYLTILIQRPVLALLGFNILFSTGIFLNGAVNAYFFTYVMKDLAMLGLVSLSQLIGLLPGIFLSRLISGKLGKKGTFIAAPLALILMFAIRWIDPTSVPLIYIATIATGFILGIFASVTPVVGADNIDYVEYKLNYRSEAAVSSISSFMAKVSNGIAGAIPGFVLGLTGYIANSQQQPASATNAIIVMSIGIPIVLYAFSSAAIGFGYNLDKNTLQMVESTLSERRAAKLNQSK